MSERYRAQHILQCLRKTYPNIKGTGLNFGNALELLVATMLSAQCPDDRVNAVTPALFAKYKTAHDYAMADIEELQDQIKSTGFYRRKAQHIKDATKMLVEVFNAEIPPSIEDLTKLPGVARKTAHIVLSNAFGIIEGLAVDTHVMRLSQRLGFTKETNRDKIEQNLMTLFQKNQWPTVTNLLITHGRNVCQARRPQCSSCVINPLCPSAFTFK